VHTCSTSFQRGYLPRTRTGDPRELCDEASAWPRSGRAPVGALPKPSRYSRSCTCIPPAEPAATDGGLLLLRSRSFLWDRESMARGRMLKRQPVGRVLAIPRGSRIAAEHCLAPSFAETVGPRYLNYMRCWSASPVTTEHHESGHSGREYQGPSRLALLQPSRRPVAVRSYLWDAVVSDLHRRAGKLDIGGGTETGCSSAPEACELSTQADDTG